MLKCRRRILNAEKAECTEAFYIRKKAELILGGVVVALALVALVITFGAILYIQKEGYQKGYSGVIDKLNNGAPDIEQYVLDEVERQGNNSKKYKSNIEIRVRDHMKIVEAVYDADRTYDLIAFNDQKKESIAGMYLYGIALGEDFCVEHPYK